MGVNSQSERKYCVDQFLSPQGLYLTFKWRLSSILTSFVESIK